MIATLKQRLAPHRMDLIRGAALAVLSVLIWCTLYNRWSIENWQTPIAYATDATPGSPFYGTAIKGDALQQLATIKAARDGHLRILLDNTVPELGAPFDANWNDYPLTEKSIYLVAGFLAKIMGIFASVNFMAMLEDVIAALAFYAACRLMNCAWLWSFVGALIFAFARFGFAHEIHHISTAYVWHVPLCLLVCRWIIREEGLPLHDWRFMFALAVAAFTGAQNPYFTNMFAQFVLIGGCVQAWHKRDWRAGIPALVLVGASAAVFIFMNSNTFLYHLMHGGNPGAVVRDYHWMEMYSLKFVDLMMPPPDHRFPPLAAWGLGHIDGRQIILSPGELPPTAYIGLAGIGALLWLAIFSLRRVADRSAHLPLEAWQVLWIMLYSDAGGVNGFFGTLGFQLFRATTRYSIFILCIVLMFAVRRLSRIDIKNLHWVYPVTIFATVIALWDQTPPVVSESEIHDISADVQSDRDFTREMERRLPEHAMIFEVPAMEFPEGPLPNVPVGSYEHFRPYLFSKPDGLRFAFGSDKGRPREEWQKEVSQSRSITDFVSKLERYGFAGLYVNRKAYPDGGQGILKSLADIGYTDVFFSEKNDLFCVVLKPSPNPQLPVSYGGLLN